MEQLTLSPDIDISGIHFAGPELLEGFVACGIECSVFEDRENPDVLHKLYHTFDAAVSACERQRIAAKHELGPDVYSGVVEYETGEDSGNLYGYATERVAVIDTSADNYDEDEIYEDTSELFDKLTELFGYWRDLHNGNIGFKNDKVICIDFGDFSTIAD